MTVPSRHWVVLLVPVFGIALWLLGRTIRSLLQTTRSATVASLPSIAEQQVTFADAVEYTLLVEGRLFTSDFARADFSLSNSAGRVMPMETIYIRSAVKSFGRVRLSLRRFTVDQPGSYTLRVTGLPSDQDADNRLIVSRPLGGAIVWHVLGIVVAGIFAIASLVGAIILLVGRRGTSP